MGVATKEKDLRLGFSVLGFPVYSLVASIQLCFQAKFVFVSNAFFFFFLRKKDKHPVNGNGDKEEGFRSRVFSFGVSCVFSCRLQSCFQADLFFKKR